jgi:hypothetical protein
VTADTYFPGGMGQHQCPGMNLSTLMTQMFLAYMTCTFDSWWGCYSVCFPIVYPVHTLTLEPQVKNWFQSFAENTQLVPLHRGSRTWKERGRRTRSTFRCPS